MADARFEDGDEQPLRLLAREAGDLKVLAALVQDAVFPADQMTYARAKHRFAIYLNRFRWEDREAAMRENRAFERVQSLLVIENVLKVQSTGLTRDKDVILSLLDITFVPGEEGAGRIELILAGDGAVALEVEALEISLRDATRPYAAPSRKAPGHD